MIDTQRASHMANLLLLNVLREVGGVDSATLSMLVQFKNALVEDLDREPDIAWLDDVHADLTKMAHGMDTAARQAETDAASDQITRQMRLRVKK